MNHIWIISSSTVCPKWMLHNFFVWKWSKPCTKPYRHARRVRLGYVRGCSAVRHAVRVALGLLADNSSTKTRCFFSLTKMLVRYLDGHFDMSVLIAVHLFLFGTISGDKITNSNIVDGQFNYICDRESMKSHLYYFNAENVVECLDFLSLLPDSHGRQNASRKNFLFMGDSRVRYQFYSFVKVIFLFHVLTTVKLEPILVFARLWSCMGWNLRLAENA